MAKIPLRTYIHEIETIIEQKQTEEAIAHCRHILLTYPKNIDTYRMLGKAYLESQRNSNAADIFQRLLSAVPDDFVSHVGMSIIREDENNLDAAIWHMERAFEGQPYNAAIQGELRRLFGLRDGMEPPKVHLTRGALARMYVKGDLHQQAIAELRSAIAEDPQRFDLQVSLGQMYANSGQDAKAIETCGGIISKLPYCLEANRILAQLLVSTDRSEEAKIYKQRVEELNPYQAYIGPNAPTEDRVPAQAVLIEQLIWDGGPAVATGDQPEWAASVGISLDDSRSVKDDLPDWMSDSSEEAPLLPASLDGEPEIEPDGIPDFMKEAGWGPSTGSYDESKSAFELDDEDVELETSEAVAGDIPDWLQQMAPPDEAVDELEDVLSPDESAPLDWLQDADIKTEDEGAGIPDWLAPVAAAGVAGAVARSSSEDDADVSEELEDEIDTPDWLLEAANAEVELPELAAEVGIPDWLQEIGEDVEISPETQGELPDWLPESLVEEDAATPMAAFDVSVAEKTGVTDWLQEVVGVEETSPEPEAELPDCLQETTEEDAATPFAAFDAPEAEKTGVTDWLQEVVGVEETSPEPEAELPDWLQEPVVDEEISPVSVIEPTEVEEEGIPDWLAPAAGAAVAASIFSSDDEKTESVAPEGTGIPDWLQESAVDEEIEPIAEIAPPEAEEESEIPDWLQESAGEEEIEPLAAIAPTEAKESEIPEWLQESAGEEEIEPLAAIAPTEAKESEIPDWLQESAGEEEIEPLARREPPKAEEEAEIPDWLQGMDEAEEVAPEPVDEGETSETEVPDWLQESAGDEEIEPIAEIAPTEAEEEAEIPDWLQESAGDEEIEPIAEIAPTEAEESEIPDWLQEVDEAEEVAPGPVDEGETSENEVPNWLQESTGEEEIEPLAAREPSKAEETIPESIDEGEPIKADIPDWLQESAVGEEFAPLAEMEPLEAEESELPDWLLEAVEDEDALPEIETEIEPTDSIRTGIPDWLQEAIDEEVPESISKAETPETDIPDWIQEIADQEPSEIIASETEDDLLPDTLKAVGTIGAAAGLAALTADDPDAQAEEVADQPGTDLSPDVREFSGDADDTDAAMAWLESLASKQGVSEDELLTSPEARSETPPDWVLQEDIDEPAVTLSEPERVETDEPIEIPPIQEEEIIEQEWSLETVIDDLAEGESSEITSDDLPDWLQDIPKETRVPHTGSLEAEAEVIPDWLQDISAEVPTIAGESEIKPETSPDDEIEDIPDWLQDLAKEQVSELEEELESETPDVPDFEDADAAMAWMESLAAKQGVSEDELLTRPEERSETPPDWVQDMVSTEAEAISEIETTPVEATLAEVEIDEIPEWLSEPIQAVESSGPLSEEEPLETEIREEQIPVLDIPEILQETPSTEMEESEIVVAEEPDTSVETEIAPELEGISSSDDIVAPDFDDADAAMAWLERLAAKQGVSEDELLTKPEERSETPPDWVRDAVLGEGAHEGVKAFTPLEETTQDEEEFLDRVLVAPESDDSAIEMEEISVASEGDEFQPVQDIPAILEETSPDEAEIPDWILDVQETEESVAETEIKPDDEMPELVEVSASEIDSTLAVDDEDFPDFEDGDAAMAWLESLAAQQGVSEDELLTSPEERSELPPDWVKDVIETEAAPELKEESFQDGDLNDWIAKVPDPVEFGELPTESKIETVSEIGDSPDADAETDFDFEDADAAMAWLESLAAKQGVSEDELLTRPDERRDTPPDWVQQAIDSEKAVVFTSIQETETKPEESEPPEIPVPEVDPDAEVPALTLPEGLSSITPPSWISDGDVPEDEEFSWLQSAVAEEQDKLLDLNKASLIQLERLPGVGFRRAQSITAYRDEHGSFRSFDDLRYVPGMDSDTLALLKSKVFIDVPEFDLGSAEVESAALFEIQVADDSIHEQQLAAQSKLNQGEISEAMSDYGDLIKKGHRLDEIIEDLNLAAEKFPEEIAIVQTLGDAYMQANQLDEALNAYTKAEGLLK